MSHVNNVTLISTETTLVKNNKNFLCGNLQFLGYITVCVIISAQLRMKRCTLGLSIY